MAFKIYFNKKTGHPSISLSGKDKTKWENLEMTHHPRKDDKYIEIICISNRKESTSYVRKYIRKDKYGVKGRKMNNHTLTNHSEGKVKTYLKEKNKKDDGNPIKSVWIPFKELTSSCNHLSISNKYMQRYFENMKLR